MKAQAISLISLAPAGAGLLTQGRRKELVKGFTSLPGVAQKPKSFVRSYFFEQAKRDVWSALFYDAADSLEKYIAVDNQQSVLRAVADGRGALLLGAHFGPSVYTFVMRKSGIAARPLIDADNYQSALRSSGQCLERLQTKKMSFWRNELDPFLSSKSEKALIAYVRAGGVATIQNDYPKKTPGGPTTSFFGRPIRFNYFAFKVSLHYTVPIFFYIFEKAERGRGFRLTFTPCPPFSTIEAGLDQYSAFLEYKISNCPFMWYTLPDFMEGQ